MTAHAKLNASSSKRWLACPPSAKLSEKYEATTSSYAEEGTQAHALAEMWVGSWLNGSDIFENELLKGCSQDMVDYISTYVDFVIERINAARAKSTTATILLEQKLDYSEWVEEGFGTGDVVIIADGVLEIIDLKYGKGIRVDAEDNSQLRLYGLGAYNVFGPLFEFSQVDMTIYQPRLSHVSTESLSLDDLLRWGDKYVKPRAVLAWKGEGEFCAGDHCKWCPANAECRARADANLEMLKYDFREPSLLGSDEIADILSKVDDLVSWAGDVKAFALNQAEQHGVAYPGWKLVEGRSNRIITNEADAIHLLLNSGYSSTDIYNTKLKGIGDLEKLLGKTKLSLLDAFITKPQGKPVLVPEADKRPPLSSAAAAQKDFSDMGATLMEQHETVRKRLGK